MRPSPLPAADLPAFARLNNIHLNGLEVAPIPGAGTGLRHVQRTYDPSKPLLTIDQDLVICAASVDEHAKSNVRLAEVLHAVGDFSRTPRGAIMIFLLLQLSTASLSHGQHGSWSEYIRFLPATVPTPSTWSVSERLLLHGTSLDSATTAKLHALRQEYLHLQTATAHIPWCASAWWDTQALAFEDWVRLDAVFRSRALQFPRWGVGMAPLVDFANHAAVPNAYYSVGAGGDVVLLPREEEGRRLVDGEEVTINYGSEKSAAELVFSYGFLPEDSMAFWLALDLHCPPDDPLAAAKEAVVRSVPMLRIVELGPEIIWTGDFVWLMCVNEEDGLGFRVLQTTDGGRRVVAVWDGEEVEVEKLEERLERWAMWEVVQLRAVMVVQERVEAQLRETEKGVVPEDGVSEEVRLLVERLRGLEKGLLEKAVVALEGQKEALLEAEAVKDYLKMMAEENDREGGSVAEVEEDEEDLS